MTFCCKGLCDTLEIDIVPTGLRYKFGHKRCSTCSIFVKTTNLGCPCCGTRLRTKSRSRKHLKKMIIP
ncbi:MAG: hypothetical protein CO032_08035 [Nitrosopumilales archaeon CG_4_9_14_0_2_um_filter_34_16]|nr:MAG: hypothetical protein CO032_08035 [Nitrosopumilales archaeon CG_4_9_14_0_2_um_filter_34_16]